MRILLPIHQARAAGGIGTVSRGLERWLPSALSVEDELITIGGNDQELGPILNVATRRLGTTGSLARLIHEQVSLPQVARQVDLIHLCDLRPIAFSRTPFIITIHDVTFLDQPRWQPTASNRYKAAMLRLALLKQPSAIVCDSHYTLERFLAHHPTADRFRPRVIYPGLAQPIPDAPPVEDAPYFLTVSTVETRKNHLTLLKAFKYARARGLKLRWKVAGAAGHGSQSILAELRTNPGIDVLGLVDESELERLYRGARFVAIPTMAEGFGFPPLEAMARGVATVCSTGSSLDETAGKGALRVPPHDVPAWTTALLRLATDEDELHRLQAAGRQQAARFSWARAAEEYVACFRDVLLRKQA